MEKTLSQLTDEVVTIYGTYESTGTAPWTYATAVHDLPYQIGSLSKLVMQLHIDLAAAWQTMLASDQDKISARAR